MLIKKYLEWRGGGDVGCLFARILARNADRHPHQAVELLAPSPPVSMAQNIESRVAAHIESPEIDISTLVLDGLTSIPDLVAVAFALKNQHGWGMRTKVLYNTPGGRVVAVRLTRDIPYLSRTVPSEALVLGNFPIFPKTRRAPVTAIELFVGTPLPCDPETGVGKTHKKVNVAHAEPGVPGSKAYEKTWKQSVKGRADSLATENPHEATHTDLRAKAKVSFVVPLRGAKDLGLR